MRGRPPARSWFSRLPPVACRLAVTASRRESHRSSHLRTRLVLETLEPLAGDRKCFRLINGVLVERTVKDVVPALKTNQEGLRKVLDDLVKQYKTKQDELDRWKVRAVAAFGSFFSPLRRRLVTVARAQADLGVCRKRTMCKSCSNDGGGLPTACSGKARRGAR